MRPLIVIILLIITGAVTVTATLYFAKPHYTQLGKENGNIDARVTFVREIDALLPKAKACSENEYAEWKEILSVKSASIYAKPIGDTSISICRAH